MNSLDIAIVLSVILIIFGIVLNYEENSINKVQEVKENENMEKLLSEIIDNLINNPGDYNWQEYKTTPGLAIVNEEGETVPNSISYQKLIALGSNYREFVDEKIFNDKIKSSIELIPQESSISSVKIGSGDNSNNIYSLNRLVKCDFYNKYVIKDFKGEGKCSHDHDNSSHSCNYFKIFKGNLRKSNFYLLLGEKEDSKYFIDTTRDKSFDNWQNDNKKVVYLNDKIDFFNDTSEVVFIHFSKKNPDACIISVPKDFDEKYLSYDYFRINNCNLIFKAWY